MARAGEPDAAAQLRNAACFVDVVFGSRLSDRGSWIRGLAMFQRLIDDVKESTSTALRLTSLAAAAAMALLVTTAFLCAAAFVFVLEQYGPVQACRLRKRAIQHDVKRAVIPREVFSPETWLTPVRTHH